jgi:hypothetical protein
MIRHRPLAAMAALEAHKSSSITNEGNLPRSNQANEPVSILRSFPFALVAESVKQTQTVFHSRRRVRLLRVRHQAAFGKLASAAPAPAADHGGFSILKQQL